MYNQHVTVYFIIYPGPIKSVRGFITECILYTMRPLITYVIHISKIYCFTSALQLENRVKRYKSYFFINDSV